MVRPISFSSRRFSPRVGLESTFVISEERLKYETDTIVILEASFMRFLNILTRRATYHFGKQVTNMDIIVPTFLTDCQRKVLEKVASIMCLNYKILEEPRCLGMEEPRYLGLEEPLILVHVILKPIEEGLDDDLFLCNPVHCGLAFPELWGPDVNFSDDEEDGDLYGTLLDLDRCSWEELQYGCKEMTNKSFKCYKEKVRMKLSCAQLEMKMLEESDSSSTFKINFNISMKAVVRKVNGIILVSTCSDEEVNTSSTMVRPFSELKEDVENDSGEIVTKVEMIVPTSFNDVQIEQLRDVALILNLNFKIVDEPRYSGLEGPMILLHVIMKPTEEGLDDPIVCTEVPSIALPVLYDLVDDILRSKQLKNDSFFIPNIDERVKLTRSNSLSLSWLRGAFNWQVRHFVEQCNKKLQIDLSCDHLQLEVLEASDGLDSNATFKVKLSKPIKALLQKVDGNMYISTRSDEELTSSGNVKAPPVASPLVTENATEARVRNNSNEVVPQLLTNSPHTSQEKAKISVKTVMEDIKFKLKLVYGLDVMKYPLAVQMLEEGVERAIVQKHTGLKIIVPVDEEYTKRFDSLEIYWGK